LVVGGASASSRFRSETIASQNSAVNAAPIIL
jgi:hypothetical protein